MWGSISIQQNVLVHPSLGTAWKGAYSSDLCMRSWRLLYNKQKHSLTLPARMQGYYVSYGIVTCIHSSLLIMKYVLVWRQDMMRDPRNTTKIPAMTTHRAAPTSKGAQSEKKSMRPPPLQISPHCGWSDPPGQVSVRHQTYIKKGSWN